MLQKAKSSLDFGEMDVMRSSVSLSDPIGVLSIRALLPASLNHRELLRFFVWRLSLFLEVTVTGKSCRHYLAFLVNAFVVQSIRIHTHKPPFFPLTNIVLGTKGVFLTLQIIGNFSLMLLRRNFIFCDKKEIVFPLLSEGVFLFFITVQNWNVIDKEVS